jgi:undecaprenyl pyrophosphate synthase
MEKFENLRVYFIYILVMILVFLFGIVKSQNICKTDVCVVEFNASWNKANSVDWLSKLNDCGVKRINIDEGDWQKKYNIVVVPTIIIFNGEEVKRYQADLSFTMSATRKQIQEEVDELIMSDF